MVKDSMLSPVRLQDDQVRPAPIYKVVLEDGTILFTNSTLERKGNIRF